MPTITTPTSLMDIVKFTFLAALFAMFGDAAIAHAMLWGNDPYWTYWITDGLLMSTVFGIGTVLFGAGVGKGAILTAVHIFLLTTYYWMLSPIGLPGHGEWLDLERTWVTGLPVHFSIYYLGYLLALWLWRHHRRMARFPRNLASIKTLAITALVMAIGIVVVLGVVQTLIQGEFPGVTWFIVRLAISFPFILGWQAVVDRSNPAFIVGGILLAFLLATYAHYLAPIGLPHESLRLIELDPPSADVHWLSYRDEYLILLPVTLIISVIGFYIGRRRLKPKNVPLSKRTKIGIPVAAVLIILTGVTVFNYTGPESQRVTITASGNASLKTGTDHGNFSNISAEIWSYTENANDHRTPMPPHDKVAIDATFTGANGNRLELIATQPMVSDPLGRFTTWAGVGYDVWHHGRSGIGNPKLPATHSEVAVYALGEITEDGRVIASGVPVHLMTTNREGEKLELHVGDPSLPTSIMSQGYLRVVWPEYSSDYSRNADYAKYAYGGIWLLILLLFAISAANSEIPHAPEIERTNTE